MSLFTNAITKSVVFTTSKPTKNTTWIVGDPNGDVVGRAVHAIVDLTAQEKAISAKKKMQMTVVLKHAKENHIRDFCELGVSPDTPMVIQNTDGEKVTYVVQDRGGQYNVKPEQVEVLQQLLGDTASDLLYTETTLGFNRTILSLPGVSEEIEKALGRVVKKLQKNDVLSDEQGDDLIIAKQKTSFKPGTLDRAAMIVGRDTTRLAAFLDTMGSSCIRYIKAS